MTPVCLLFTAFCVPLVLGWQRVARGFCTGEATHQTTEKSFLKQWPVNTDLYAILKTTEKLEWAFVRGYIEDKTYEKECYSLIRQYKILWQTLQDSVGYRPSPKYACPWQCWLMFTKQPSGRSPAGRAYQSLHGQPQDELHASGSKAPERHPSHARAWHAQPRQRQFGGEGGRLRGAVHSCHGRPQAQHGGSGPALTCAGRLADQLESGALLLA
jgi:VPS28 protein